MKEIDDIFNDWSDEEWSENDYSLSELSNELKECVNNNDFSSYFETLDELKDVCESYMRYNVIVDYDVQWDKNSVIDIQLTPINKVESIKINININIQ